jgi:hypothetical protein
VFGSEETRPDAGQYEGGPEVFLAAMLHRVRGQALHHLGERVPTLVRMLCQHPHHRVLELRIDARDEVAERWRDLVAVRIDELEQ